MASTVVMQRHWWLTLSDITDRNKAVFLKEQIPAVRKFWQSFEFKLRMKQVEAQHDIIPRHDTKPKLIASFHRLTLLLPTAKRAVPSSAVSVLLVGAQPPSQVPHQLAWSKGPPLGPGRDFTPSGKKAQSS